MDRKELSDALSEISSTRDLLEKAMKLAGLVTSMFANRGYELVVVGGAAIEFYTEGEYMSGDIDLCRKSITPVPPRIEREIMGELGGIGGPRSWQCQDLYVDVLGFLENEARTPLRQMETPYGMISVISPEMLIVERSLMAVYPQPDKESHECVRKLLIACLKDLVPFSWDEVLRLAADKRYDITADVIKLREEIENEFLR
jgi:hypothetical protein